MYYHPYIYNYPYYYYVPAYSRPFVYPHISTNEREVVSDNDGNILFGSVYDRTVSKDAGKRPFVINIEDATEENSTFRKAIWTGKYLQVTLMSIDINDDIGLEVHPSTDQFLRIEEGNGIVQMGDSREHLSFQRRIRSDDAIMIPAGKWHNIINTGRKALKLYSIYAPPEHPYGTIHQTKADEIAAEENKRFE